MTVLSAEGLYDPAHEHDACGVGFVAHIKNQKSHGIIEQGLLILQNLEHRGATGYDPLLGDGAGILIQIPDAFFRAEMALQGVTLPAPGKYGVGMVFLPRGDASLRSCEAYEAYCKKPEVMAQLGADFCIKEEDAAAAAMRKLSKRKRS